MVEAGLVEPDVVGARRSRERFHFGVGVGDHQPEVDRLEALIAEGCQQSGEQGLSTVDRDDDGNGGFERHKEIAYRDSSSLAAIPATSRRPARLR